MESDQVNRSFAATVDLAVLSVEELKELAKTNGISGYSGLKRPQLVALLRRNGVGDAYLSGQSTSSSPASSELGKIMFEIQCLSKKLSAISDLEIQVKTLQAEVVRLKDCNNRCTQSVYQEESNLDKSH
eukprot:scpid109071/ scgid23725/ 